MHIFCIQNDLVHRSVKPQILSVFGDVALALGPEFKKYLEVVMNTLMQATQATVDRVRLTLAYLSVDEYAQFEAFDKRCRV